MSVAVSKRTIAKYERLITKSRVWTKGEIKGFLKLLRSRNYLSDKSACAEINRLATLFAEHASARPYGITPEHVAQGRDFLASQVLKTRNGVRAGCGFDDDDAEVLSHIRTFKFVGIHVEYNTYNGAPYIVGPIYRIIASKGRTLDYCPVHWGAAVVEHYGGLNFLG